MNTPTVSTIPERYAADLELKGFNIHMISNPVTTPHSIGRRNFYKIVLITGHLTVGYGDKTSEIKDTCLFFANPKMAHSVIHHSTDNTGYACIFTDAFFVTSGRSKLLQNSPLVRTDIKPIIPLNSDQAAFMTNLYQKILSVRNSDYHYRKELIKSCIEIILHEAVSIQSSQRGLMQKNAAARITHLFLELLERQFPIESTTDPLRLRNAQDFAESLSVHVNYLNRSVKKVTGKPTTAHIVERIVAEAKDLLQYTDWSVADIAYSLGFDYPTYFNNYFKRTTGFAPKSFRRREV
ncbi:MAG TPA: helix-turn-helix domain-containing protein [Aequorivita sp.]|nr:helix-turn-helix domain-containing protein [Aequorivita sp.]